MRQHPGFLQHGCRPRPQQLRALVIAICPARSHGLATSCSSLHGGGGGCHTRHLESRGPT
jgi:hypothetical protein